MPVTAGLTPDHHEVAVIGGGVIGLAIAWRVAQAGKSVVVIDPAPASAASYAAAGMLAPISEARYGEEPLLQLGLESLARYPTFVTALEAEAGQSVGLRCDGTLIVATDAGDRAELGELHEFQTRLGLTATLLTSRECRELDPALSPDIRCGLHVASDFSIDNRRLTAALLTASRSRGVRILTSRVTEVSTTDPGRHSIVTDDGGTISADQVVVAAGPWSNAIPGIAEADQPPVRPVKGEIIRLTARAGGELPRRSLRGFVNGREIYLVPREDGELVVGATVEELGFDTTVRSGAVREMLRDARAVFPMIDGLEFTEAIAALRPGSPDNAPIIGATTTPGLLVATGHHRNGILLTPVTADLICALITNDDADVELLTAVSPQRFAEVRT
jgi:glycine oxidase